MLSFLYIPIMLCFMKIPIVEMHLQLCFIVWVRLSMGIQGNCQLSDSFACAVVLSVFAVISLLSFHCRNSSNWNRHCCRWMRVMQCILMKFIRMHILQLNKTIGSWSDNSDEFPNGRRTIHGFIINFRTSIYSIIFHINKQMIQLCSVPPQNILKLLNIPF